MNFMKAQAQWYINGNTLNTNGTDWFGSINAQPLIFKVGGSQESARFINGGNFGIGTQTPSDRLSVTDTRTTTGCTAILGLSTGANAGTGYAGYFSKTGASVNNVGGYFSASGGTNNYGLIVGNGNVGIGTTAPTFKLQVSGSLNNAYDGAISINNTGTGDGAVAQIIAQNNASKYNQQLIWGSGATGTRFGLTKASLAEITVSAPNFAIGTIGAYPLSFITNSVVRMTMLSGGNVGIGTTTPNNLLQVSGLINFDNNLYSTFIGYQAGGSISTGYENTILGYRAYYSNTSGYSNTALGVRALFFNTAGSHNTALGHEALYYNFDGIFNTALGYGTLFENNSGSNNTALGAYGLAGNYTGTYNTAIGYSADVAAGNYTNATAIGANAIVGASNSVVLGGTGSNAVNVGIGTTTPSDRLSVTDTRTTTGCTAILGLSTGANAGTGYAGYFSKTGASVTNVGGYFSATGGTTNNYGLIVANGLAGIGTTTPTNNLDVVTGAAGSFGNYALFRTSGGYSNQGGILLSNAAVTGGNSLKITSTYNGTINAWTNASIGFVLNSATETWITQTGSLPSIQLIAQTGNICLAQGIGNVGIGTATPTDRLSVTDTRTTTGCTAILGLSTGANVGTGYAGYFSKTGASVTNVGGYFSATGGTTNNYGLIVANGNVGIGTTAPTSILHTIASGLKTANYTGNLLTNIATSQTEGVTKAGLQVISTGTWNVKGSKNIGLWVSAVTGAEPTFNYDAIFNGGGTVGIGMDAPGSQLQVMKNVAIGYSATTIAPENGLCVNGNVCIGPVFTTTPGGYKLIVEGKVGAREYVATADLTWPDYVFNKEYELMPLKELENFINANKHLPAVPSASEIKEKGVNLGEMDATLLKKVEELTIYLIDLKKENEQLKSRISNLENK